MTNSVDHDQKAPLGLHSFTKACNIGFDVEISKIVF